ncbi:hypothetical protein ACGFX4_30605 [Kitasatospora sp. NPDC048365]|uniref:hypothetical protein n=1 Tax=Kitasatospora sp. NPDC048365 TaxID=3364050 RepID=UPI0037118070
MLALLVPAVAACGSDGSSSPASTPGSSLTAAPNPSNFSGSPPSALASAASSALASAEAAQSSAEAAASSFAASGSEQVNASRTKASEVLQATQGEGNAMGDVVITGVPRTTTGGLHAAIVTITNSTNATASYAVQVAFKDEAGQVADTSVVWAENLAAGQKAQPVAFSRKPADMKLVAVVTKAQRY